MTPETATLAQYLREAHATEVALIRVLQEQIALAPRGPHRTLLEEHLEETRSHATRVRERLGAIEAAAAGGSVVRAGMALAQGVAGQALALGKTPFDLLRGTGVAEKVLKNAKDACATEALEIATYATLERLATALGDEETAALAASIRGDEERMLEGLVAGLPGLTDAVVEARGDGAAGAAAA
ncbi:DUF892 family protein [Patulibacter sp. S7RM1-6]